MLVLPVGWRTGPWACRSLAAAGFPVVGAHEPARLRGSTRACRTLVRYPAPARDADGFLAALERICARYGIGAVLPLDDDIVELLNRGRDRLDGVTVVGPTLEQHRALCDKAALAEAARAAGFAVPGRALVGPAGRDGDWPALPSLVKPKVTSVESARLKRRKPVIVRTARERERVVQALLRELPEVLVEEQVRGRAWRVHFLRAAGAAATVTLCAVRNFPAHTGQSTVQTVVRDGGPEALVRNGLRLLELVDYRGPGSIQVLERDAALYVHDVNLRLPITVGVTIRAGLDLPALAVATALGEPLRAPGKVQGVTYVSLEEVRHLVASLRGCDGTAPAGRIAADLLRGLVRRDFVLDQLDPRDPVPSALAIRELGVHLHRDLREPVAA